MSTISPGIVTLDVETTGLDTWRHQPWEVTYAVGEEDPVTLLLRHNENAADPEALAMNGYAERWDPRRIASTAEIAQMQRSVSGRYLCGANIRFDIEMLVTSRWLIPTWHHRTLDLSGMGALMLGEAVPVSLHRLCERLNSEYDAAIPMPDHSSRGDVIASREALRFMFTWRERLGQTP